MSQAFIKHETLAKMGLDKYKINPQNDGKKVTNIRYSAQEKTGRGVDGWRPWLTAVKIHARRTI